MKSPLRASEDIRLLPEFVCKAVLEEEDKPPVPSTKFEDQLSFCLRFSRAKDKPRVPSTKEYVEALLQLESNITTKQRALLEAHYRAPGHKATASKLAAAVGYTGHRAVNAQYGKLGSMLRKALNYTAQGQASSVLASFIPPSSRSDEWVFQMHPPLARALNQLGWV